MSLRERLEHQRPGYPYSTGRTLAIFGALMATIMVAALDQTIVATALPKITSDLGGIGGYSWVFSAFLLCQTVTVPIYGKLGDVYGRRRLLFVAIPLFIFGSVLCGASQDMTQLIVFRGIQGLGAGGVIPLALSTTAQLVPPRERGRYQGLIGAAFATSAVIGPTVGGLIADNTTWRWIFFVNLPVGIAALMLIALTMPSDMPRHRVRVDYFGAGLLAIGVGSLLVALNWGGQSYPWASVQVLGLLLASAIFLGALVVVERRTAEPIVPFALLREPVVGAAAAATALTGLVIFAVTAYLPLFVQGVVGASATSSGVVLIPLALASTLSMFISANLVQRTGHYRTNMLVGSVILIAGTMLLWRMGVATTRTEVVFSVIVVGVGVGTMMQLFVLAGQNAVAYNVLGTTTAMISFARAIGTTAGVTFFGLIVDHGLPAELRGRTVFAGGLPAGQRRSLAVALHPAFLLLGFVSGLVFLVVALGMQERPLRQSVREPEPTAAPP